MRYYETLFIITPELAEEEVAPVIEKFSGILTDRGATMVKIDNWGRRRLAYEVKKFSKGYYVLFEYGSDPDAVAEMERNFKIDDQIIRFLTIKKDENFDPDAIPAEPEDAEKSDRGGDDYLDAAPADDDSDEYDDQDDDDDDDDSESDDRDND